MKDLNVLESLKSKILNVDSHTYVLYGDCAYIASKSESGKFGIFGINSKKMYTKEAIHFVKEPTKEQYANALLNYILDDNATNESKKGIYNLSISDLYFEFLDTETDLKFGRTSAERITTRFGLNKNDEVLADLTKKVVASYNKEEVVNK